MAFNVMEHDLVPEHHLLSQKEATAVLKDLRVEREQLPKVKRSDPCIKFLEQNLDQEVSEGRIVKIVRRSATAGVFVAYRVVVER